MICRNNLTKEDFNYSFIENNCVKLENKFHTVIEKYENWINNYYIINKLASLEL